MTAPKPFIHSDKHKPKPITAIGSRVAIAIACWAVSSIGIMLSLFLFTASSVGLLFKQSLAYALQNWVFYLGLGVLYSWVALAILTSAWINNAKASTFWTFSGASAGLICAIFTMPTSLVCLPCMVLGVYLFYFHAVLAQATQ